MYRAIRNNKINTVLIMVLFVLLLAGIGVAWSITADNWVIAPLVTLGAFGYALLQYFTGAKQALKMAGAVEITEADNPRLYRTVENLAIATGIPTPKVYIVEDPAPNAFATGNSPKNAAVAATTGLLDIMTDAELEGVMAHEIGHVKNYDIRLSMIAYALTVAVAFLADTLMRASWFSSAKNSKNSNSAAGLITIVALLVYFIAPIIATVIRLAVSRQREYLADATGALTTRDPEALASALHKINVAGAPLQKQSSNMSHMWLADPQTSSFLHNLFATHPPIPNRIRRLLENSAKF